MSIRFLVPLRVSGFLKFSKIQISVRDLANIRFLKNRYHTHRFAIRAISVFRVKFNVEFTHQAVNFSIKSIPFEPTRIDISLLQCAFN